VALPSALLRLLPGTYTGMLRTRRAAAALALALALALSWMGSGVRGDDLDEVCSADDRRSQYVPTSKLVWVVVLAAFVAMAMGFGIGANDSANSWGTSVGSGAIPVRYAVLLGGGMEFLGATSLGYGVSGTIQKGVSDLEDPDCWACGSCNSLMSVYMTAMFAALIGGASFLGLATFTAMPVSTTHAIVGGVVGATIACTGFGCLNWSFDGGLGGIVASWVISPLLSGAVGVGLFVLTQRTIIKTVDPRRNALRALPILVASTAFVMLSLILLKAKVAKDMAEWLKFLIAAICAAAAGLSAQYLFVPFVQKKLDTQRNVESLALEPLELDGEEDLASHKLPLSNDGDEDEEEASLLAGKGNGVKAASGSEGNYSEVADESQDVKDARFVFRYLLVCIAALESFAHGANDTANASSAFSAVYQTYHDGDSDCDNPDSPPWLMALVGGFVALGVITAGHRVIKTIGENLAKIDFQTGFCIEFASTLTVILATLVSLPVSSTHCQVGAVVFVGGWQQGIRNVKWSLFGKIAISWAVTLPFAGGVTAILSLVFRKLIER